MPAQAAGSTGGSAWQVMACPFCGSREARPWGLVRGAPPFDDEHFPLAACRRCALVYTIRRRACLESLYQETFRGEHGERFHHSVERVVRWLERWRARRLARGRPSGDALDIGCGRGLFLAELRRLGWRVVGTEVARAVTTRSHRRQLDVPIREGDFLDLAFPAAQFDLVTLWHVLEHLPHPRVTLEKARAIVRPGGLLVIGVPNLASWQARWFGRRWLHLNPPYHLSHFTADRLCRALEETAWDVVRVQHLHGLWVQNLCGWLQGLLDRVMPTPQLWLRSMQRSWADWYAAQPRRRRFRLAAELAVSHGLAALCLPLGIVLMVAESLAGAGGTIQVLARPRAPIP